MDKQVLSLAKKFNGILEKVISGDKKLHILKIHLELHSGNFDRMGNLTPAGRNEFWRCIDNEF